MKRRDLLAAGATLMTAPAFVRAQSPAWPTRGTIRLIAQFPPGGLVDTVSRLMAPHLSQALGQSVVVENRPGAGGLVGTDYVSKQPADGYTLLVSHASVHVYAAATRRTMPFDPVTDFSHIGMLVEAPMVLLVRPASPFQTLEQYVNAAKTQREAQSGEQFGLLAAAVEGMRDAPGNGAAAQVFQQHIGRTSNVQDNR